MADAHKTFPVGWDEFHRNAKALSWRLIDSKTQWKGIIAVARGGLIPAGIVARELEIKLVDSVCISSYEDSGTSGVGQQKAASMAKGSTLIAGDGAGWLVIDDLVDTGKTFELMRKLWPAAHYAAIYAKPAGRAQVDTFITEVSQDTWIYFPWDIEPQFSQPVALRHQSR